MILKFFRFSGGETSANSAPVSASNQESVKVPVIKGGSAAKEIVGDQLLLPEELMHPFMNQPSQTEIHDFFARFNNAPNHSPKRTNFDESGIVGAINPRMFERFQSRQDNLQRELDNGGNSRARNDSEIVRTSMKLQGQVLKPFLGQLKNKKKLFKQKHKPNDEFAEEYGKYQSSDLPVYTYDELDLYEPTPFIEEPVSYEENVYK